MRDAYAFLMQQFRAGDTLYMFGFSRGAYTVRAVASLLYMYGLLPAGNEPLIPYAIRMLNAVSNYRDGRGFDLAEDFRSTFRGYLCKPHFIGLWDTVNSVGWIENPLKLPYSASNPDIAIGRHAVAMDERRAFFRTNLWRPPHRRPSVGLETLSRSGFQVSTVMSAAATQRKKAGSQNFHLSGLRARRLWQGYLLTALGSMRLWGGRAQNTPKPILTPRFTDR